VVQADYETEEANVIEDTDTGMYEMRGHSRKIFVSQPFSAGIECPVASEKKRQGLNCQPLFCTFFVSDFSGHSLFFRITVHLL